MDEAAQSLNALEEKLEYRFQNSSLLEEALTHPSALLQRDCDAMRSNNQRLEFLGDAVLGMVLAEALYAAFPQEREGFLTRARAALIKGETLASIARELRLYDFLILGEADRNNGIHEQDATLEDALEAVIGALYLDGGYSSARACVLRWYGDLQTHADTALSRHNPKGELQEYFQQRQPPGLPEYRLLREDGPPHARTFSVAVYIDDVCLGEGTGSSKKLAEQEAATQALNYIETTPPNGAF